MSQNFYAVLGLRPGATDFEIKSAFRLIDNIQGADINKSVCSAAFRVLGNAFSRSAYDRVHGFSSQPQGRKTARRDIDGSAMPADDEDL
jgi:DnaJ-class molecular chaperone